MPAGRPSDYKEEYNEQVVKLCRLGATDKEIADFFGVCEKTINNWKNEHPKFLQSIKEGKEYSDMKVADSLYNKALGGIVKLEKAFKLREKGGGERIEMVEVDEYIIPDTTAAIFWLKNRKSDAWKDKSEQHVKVDGSVPIQKWLEANDNQSTD